MICPLETFFYELKNKYKNVRFICINYKNVKLFSIYDK